MKTSNNNAPPFKFINPSTLYNPTKNAYSHIAVVENYKRIIHISGQGGENIHSVLSDHFEDQISQVFINIENALMAAHAELFDIAKLSVLIVGYNPQKHEILIHHMKKLWKNTSFPACTLIPVHCLALPNMQIEIEATAYCNN